MRSLVVAVCVIAASAAAARADDKVPVWLGITYTLGGTVGVPVTEVHEETGAAQAGLRPGDEIIELNGVQTPAGSDLKPLIAPLKVGDHAKLKILRAGKVLAVDAVLLPRVSGGEIIQRRLVDKPAPEFAIARASDGVVVDLSAIKGKVAILAFFPASCDACAGVMSALGPWSVKHDRDPVVILGAGVPLELASVRAYLARNPTLIPVGAASSDPDHPPEYIADSTEEAVTFAVIDAKGIVRTTSVIAPGSEDELDDVCVAAERALKALKRR